MYRRAKKPRCSLPHNNRRGNPGKGTFSALRPVIYRPRDSPAGGIDARCTFSAPHRSPFPLIYWLPSIRLSACNGTSAAHFHHWLGLSLAIKSRADNPCVSDVYIYIRVYTCFPLHSSLAKIQKSVFAKYRRARSTLRVYCSRRKSRGCSIEENRAQLTTSGRESTHKLQIFKRPE